MIKIETTGISLLFSDPERILMYHSNFMGPKFFLPALVLISSLTGIPDFSP